MSFLHPLLALGALLFAVPLIIHLLNRRKFRSVRWAAMEFLLQAYKRTRRRLRLENLILLLLRCAIPVFLALAVARPVLEDAGVLSGLDPSRHHVLLLDTSYSMGYQPPGGDSPFERAKRMGRSILAGIEKTGVQKISLLTSGIRTRTLVSGEINVERVRQVWNDISRPSDGGHDLLEGIQEAVKLADKSPEPVKLYVLTDLQTRCLPEPLASPKPGSAAPTTPPTTPPGAPAAPAGKDAVAEALLRLKELTGEALFLDCHPGGETENLQVSAFELEQRNATVRIGLDFLAKVANRSPARKLTEALFEVDGQVQRRERVEVDAGAEVQVRFSTSFVDEGFHSVTCRLQADGLAADDERHLSVSVRKRVRILLVDGSEERDPQLRETFLIRNLLDPSHGEGDSFLTLFQPTEIDRLTWSREREDLSEYDLVLLCNLDRVSEGDGRRLGSYVRGGGALMVVVGDQVQPDTYNLHLYRLDGTGPLPLRLRTVTGNDFGSANWFSAEILKPDHPVLRDFGENKDLRTLFEAWPIYRYFTTELPAAAPAAAGRAPAAPTAPADPSQLADLRHDPVVLARVRDEAGSPLLVTRLVGLGKSLLFTSSLNSRPNKWNLFEKPYFSIPLLHQSVLWLTMPETDPYNILVGRPLVAVSRLLPRDVSVVLPVSAGGSKRAVAGDARQIEEGRFVLPPFLDTERSGIYRLESEVERLGVAGKEPFLFAVNVDPEEGVLTYLPGEQLKLRLPGAQVTSELPTDIVLSKDRNRGEVGPQALYLVLLFLVGEALMAAWVGRRRR
jgi:hypothetical protein